MDSFRECLDGRGGDGFDGWGGAPGCHHSETRSEVQRRTYKAAAVSTKGRGIPPSPVPHSGQPGLY